MLASALCRYLRLPSKVYRLDSVFSIQVLTSDAQERCQQSLRFESHARIQGDHIFHLGEGVSAYFDMEKVTMFDPKTENVLK